MKIWLDDNRPAPDGWIWVKTAGDAVGYLAMGTVTDISLDNDLGDINVVGDGYMVAQYIEEQAYIGGLPPLNIIVHTQNPVQGAKMIVAMRNAIRYWDGQGSVIRRPYSKD